MLTEWLEKEASQDMEKTAAQQFEAELDALDTHSVVEAWRAARSKEASASQRLMQAVPQAVSGSVLGGVVGGGLGAASAPKGERADAAWRGAATGAATGAVGGGVMGASINPKRVKATKDYIENALRGPSGRSGSPQVRGYFSRSHERKQRRRLAEASHVSGGEVAGTSVGRVIGAGGAIGGGLHAGSEAERKRAKRERMATKQAASIGGLRSRLSGLREAVSRKIRGVVDTRSVRDIDLSKTHLSELNTSQKKELTRMGVLASGKKARESMRHSKARSANPVLSRLGAPASFLAPKTTRRALRNRVRRKYLNKKNYWTNRGE